MKRLHYSLPRKALVKLFTCRIRPIIKYSNFIYDICPIYLSNRLEQLQTEAGRICTGAMRHTSADTIILSLHPYSFRGAR